MATVLDIGVDLGTASVVIYGKGKDVVLNEPAVIAFDRESRNVLAVGEEARRMLGRTPSNIAAIRPLQNGMIADMEMACTMLRYFIGKVGDLSVEISYAVPRYVKKGGRFEISCKGAVVVNIIQSWIITKAKAKGN